MEPDYEKKKKKKRKREGNDAKWKQNRSDPSRRLF